MQQSAPATNLRETPEIVVTRLNPRKLRGRPIQGLSPSLCTYLSLYNGF